MEVLKVHEYFPKLPAAPFVALHVLSGANVLYENLKGVSGCPKALHFVVRVIIVI